MNLTSVVLWKPIITYKQPSSIIAGCIKIINRLTYQG